MCIEAPQKITGPDLNVRAIFDCAILLSFFFFFLIKNNKNKHMIAAISRSKMSLVYIHLHVLFTSTFGRCIRATRSLLFFCFYSSHYTVYTVLFRLHSYTYYKLTLSLYDIASPLNYFLPNSSSTRSLALE